MVIDVTKLKDSKEIIENTYNIEFDTIEELIDFVDMYNHLIKQDERNR